MVVARGKGEGRTGPGRENSGLLFNGLGVSVRGN